MNFLLLALQLTNDQVDCLTFFDNFDTAQSLVERWGERDVPEEDDRNVTELLVSIHSELFDIVMTQNIGRVGFISPEIIVPRRLMWSLSQIEFSNVIILNKTDLVTLSIPLTWHC